MQENDILTLEKLEKELRPYHNDICILYETKLVRLIGVCDGGDDFYYIVDEIGRDKYFASCVGDIVSLKGIYPEEKYKNMDEIFALNNCPKTDEFILEMRI